jgi:glycosyltransferase involved in cell wall biosynthesis
MPADKQLNIVFWSFPSWNDEYMKSTIELAKELALRHRVLYIDYAFTIKDVLPSGKTRSVPRKNIFGKNGGLRKIKLNNGGEVEVLSLPPVFPFNWISNKKIYNAVESVNQWLVASRIKKALQKIGWQPDVIVNAFNPFFGHATQHIFKTIPLVYYCYDNIDAAAWAKKHGARLEKEIIQQADAVVFTSDALQQTKKGTKKSFVISNGVDARVFEKAIGEKTLSRSSEKIVGYTGCIDNRLDYELLEEVVKQNAQLKFEFIGPVTCSDAGKLKKYRNVNFTGMVKPAQLPKAMKNFDAGIIPFVKNNFTRNIYPMKANEYLAMGIPVVATDFATLNDLNNYLEIAYNPVEFSTKLQQSLGTDSQSKQQERRLKARANSWEQKSLEFEKILKSVIR